MRKFVIEQWLLKLNWSRVAMYQSQPRRVRKLFVGALTQYKFEKLNVFVLKMCTHLHQLHHRCLKEKSYSFSDVCGIILGPVYKSCCNPSCTIHGAWHGADWKLTHGSSMDFFHKERALWRLGFFFSLVLKWKICSVMCICQQGLNKKYTLFLAGKTCFDIFLTSSRSWKLTF